VVAQQEIPLVRCRLDGAEETGPARVRYVPLSEFELWRYLMETRHGRQVYVEAVSVWVAEDPALWNSGYQADELEPVLRIRLTSSGPLGVPTRVERFFPAETYPLAQESLLRHHAPCDPKQSVEATAGYFLPQGRYRSIVAA
jgi:hypothetical protein